MAEAPEQAVHAFRSHRKSLLSGGQTQCRLPSWTERLNGSIRQKLESDLKERWTLENCLQMYRIRSTASSASFASPSCADSGESLVFVNKPDKKAYPKTVPSSFFHSIHAFCQLADWIAVCGMGGVPVGGTVGAVSQYHEDSP
jgi:hypothetical protein